MGRNKVIDVFWAILTLAMTGNCVYLLASHGTTYAWLMAISCAIFPIVAFVEAAKFRARGAIEAAQAISSCTVLAVAIFMFLAIYVDRAQQTSTGGGQW